MKGYITGYYKGMYKKTSYKLDSECFGNQMYADSKTILGVTDTPDQEEVDWLTDLITVQQLGLYFVKYCDYDDALYDFTKFCTDHEDNCSMAYMGQSIMGKVFQLTTVATDMS